MQLLEDELRTHRTQKYTGNEKLGYLKESANRFPHVTSLTLCVLGIPATQIDNERLFSLARRIARPVRNLLNTETIDGLVCAANIPVESGQVSE
jgi:hAT family C-terminal dimerisation region